MPAFFLRERGLGKVFPVLVDFALLRSWSYGEYNSARVIGDEIIHKGRAVTPKQFAQSFARSTRNAWEDLKGPSVANFATV